MEKQKTNKQTNKQKYDMRRECVTVDIKDSVPLRMNGEKKSYMYDLIADMFTCIPHERLLIN